MDRRAIVAIALSLLFLFFYRDILKLVGLDHHLQPAPPPVAVDSTEHAAPAPERVERLQQPVPPPAEPSAIVGRAERPGIQFGAAHADSERIVEVETPLYRARFSSLGARLLSVTLKPYALGLDGNGELAHPIPRGQEVPPEHRVELRADPLFGIDLGSGNQIRSLAGYAYAVEESLDAAGSVRVVHFIARDSGGAFVRQSYQVRPDTYGFDLEVEIRGLPFDAGINEYSLTTRSWPPITEADLDADSRVLRASSMVGSSVHREGIGGLRKGTKTMEGNVAWAGVQSRYFLSAVALLEGVSRSVSARADKRMLPAEVLEGLPAGKSAEAEVAINSMVMALPAGTDVRNRFFLYVGPAEFSRLEELDARLEGAVDLGWSWLAPFSRALLWVLNWLFELLRNYGVAIVVLATLVRVLLHPLNMISMKSMRAMQRVQPEVERIRQKFKNDPQAMNTAIMALYKEHKINPAGGCLPLLLQMPLFIALYQVLFNAIELRQAPFVGWMNDLSAPDLLFSIGPFPVRLLPLLMAASGFLTQKLTPTDPRQMTTMYLMNVVMLVFFYNLPSGLVLYWTVMNFLTAFQQWLILRQDGHAPAVAQAPASVPASSGKKRRMASR